MQQADDLSELNLGAPDGLRLGKRQGVLLFRAGKEETQPDADQEISEAGQGREGDKVDGIGVKAEEEQIHNILPMAFGRTIRQVEKLKDKDRDALLPFRRFGPGDGNHDEDGIAQQGYQGQADDQS